MQKVKSYDLEERLLLYSVRIIKLTEKLPNTRVGNHVAGQLLRSRRIQIMGRLRELSLQRILCINFGLL